MKKYIIKYRNEFIVEVYANSEKEARIKAENSRKWQPLTDLHPDMIEVDELD